MWKLKRSNDRKSLVLCICIDTILYIILVLFNINYCSYNYYY